MLFNHFQFGKHNDDDDGDDDDDDDGKTLCDSVTDFIQFFTTFVVFVYICCICIHM